jgi:hypothetical protein
VSRKRLLASYRFLSAGNEPGKLFLSGHRHGY